MDKSCLTYISCFWQIYLYIILKSAMYIFHVNQCNDVHDTLAYAHMSEPYMLSLKYY